MAATAEELECPFCGYNDRSSYMLMLHVEERHTDNSPFVVREGPDAASQLAAPSPGRHGVSSYNLTAPAAASDVDDDEQWMLCPNPECGEQIPLEDLNEHLDLHYAEGLLETQQQHQASAATVHSSSASPHTASQPSMQQAYGKMPRYTPSISSEHSLSAADDSYPSGGRAEDGRRRHHRESHRQAGYAKSRPRSDSEKSSISRTIRDVLVPTGGKKLKAKEPGARSARLGKSELGPYAFEEQMPRSLYKQIEAGPKVSWINRIGRDGRLIKHEVVDNETPGVVPVLAQLCAIDKSVDRVYLCHPSTIHIFKRPREGGFCGYRNIQMLVSYIQGAKAQGHAQFPPRTPGILVLQDLIEQAWDMGINEVSRIQTGGIRGTRKYIGTPEVQALLRSLRIDHGLQIFSDRPGAGQAHEQLLAFIESYFREGTTREQREQRPKVVKTHLPPIYLQQPGHSITVVGYERHKDGQCNLLVFDPMFHTSPGMSKILGRRDIRTPRPEVLQAYRRGDRQLKRHRDYELITLKAHPPLFPAWDVLEQFIDYSYVYAFFHVPSFGYDIIPEEQFPLVFPWWNYGGLFCIDDARFACNPAHSSYPDNDERFLVDNVEDDTDTGLLGGIPPQHDKNYLNWIGLFDNIKKMVVPGGYGKEARTRVNEALRTSKDLADDLLFQQPFPEDIYFEKTVDPAVPVHYACGSPLRRGFQHHALRRCGPASPHPSSGSSSGPSAITSTSSMSPEFNHIACQPFWPRCQGQRGFRTSIVSASESPYPGSCSSFCPLQRFQQKVYEVISPRLSLPYTSVPSKSPQGEPSAIRSRRDSGISMLEPVPTYKNPITATISHDTPTIAIAAPRTYCSQHHQCQTQTSPPHHQPNQQKTFVPPSRSQPIQVTRSATHAHHLLNQHHQRRTNSIASPPKLPLAPPVLDLGSVDLFACTPSFLNLNHHTFAANADGGRQPTPVHELRDFFFERGAEGEQTPVFYGTGGNDVSRGWRAKMGAEW